MKLFQHDAPSQSYDHREVYSLYELAYTTVDLMAALLFVVGSVMFFYQSWVNAGTWCFLVGSVLFGVKPTLRFVRELHYLRLGKRQEQARQQARP